MWMKPGNLGSKEQCTRLFGAFIQLKVTLKLCDQNMARIFFQYLAI